MERTETQKRTLRGKKSRYALSRGQVGARIFKHGSLEAYAADRKRVLLLRKIRKSQTMNVEVF